MKIKRLLVSLLAASLVMSMLVGCGGADNVGTDGSNKTGIYGGNSNSSSEEDQKDSSTSDINEDNHDGISDGKEPAKLMVSSGKGEPAEVSNKKQ